MEQSVCTEDLQIPDRLTAFRVTRDRIRQIEANADRNMLHPTRIRMLEGFIELPGA